ncbi:MAG: hypothetical protein F9K29_21440 [Hyphomicrobiaceae bacterium]|nr:MAG: hypothetical protein F9K29_21440 [Hyphomicrobiaceae bacterium]
MATKPIGARETSGGNADQRQRSRQQHQEQVLEQERPASFPCRPEAGTIGEIVLSLEFRSKEELTGLSA